MAPLARAGVVTPQRFVIYCPPRTGSSLLASLFDSHPSVRCEGELLAKRVPRPLAWFDGRSASARLQGQLVWGCKVISQHLRWFPDTYGEGGQLLRDLVERDYKLIVLRRRDWLLQALSAAHAGRTQYHFTSDDATSFDAMRVDPVEVLSLLLTMEQEDAVVTSSVADLPHVELWYEDDLQTPDRQQRTLDRLTDELGIEPATVSSRYVSVAPPSFAGRVANADEVAELIASTRFAPFLDRHAFEG
jgi:hypothetical protein